VGEQDEGDLKNGFDLWRLWVEICGLRGAVSVVWWRVVGQWSVPEMGGIFGEREMMGNFRENGVNDEPHLDFVLFFIFYFYFIRKSKNQNT
jgi:hypothetical protein